MNNFSKRSEMDGIDVDSRMDYLRVSWFCIVFVFGGIIQLITDYSGLDIPVQAAARLLLVLTAIPLLIAAKIDASQMVPPSVRLAIGLLFLSAVISFAKDLYASTNVSDATASLVFMYGLGGLLVLALFVPLSARFHHLFFGLTAVTLGFGLAQLFAQNLFLPEDYLESVGIIYQNFVNERIRLVSFFRSAPRFAEFLTFISLIVLYQIVAPVSAGLAKVRVLLMAVYAVVTVLLFNTYSRAGYILFIISTVTLLLLLNRVVRQGRGFGPLSLYALFSLAVTAVVLTVLDKLPLDRTVLDTSSLDARTASWSILTDRIDRSSVMDLLFGYGVVARFTRGDARYFIVDNLALAFLLYSGIVGLLVAVFLSAASVRFAANLRAQGAGMVEPWMAFIPGLWVQGLFVDNHNTLFIALIAMLGILSSLRRRLAMRMRSRE